MPRVHDEQIDDRILDAAQAEIDRTGFVGMRVATVARVAGTTVAMIYRRFTDREGLQAATLARYMDRRMDEIIGFARSVIDLPRPITIDDVLDATPPLRYPGSALVHYRRQRTYVAATENDRLREIVREIASRRLPEFAAAVEEMVERLPEEQRFDPRVYSVFAIRHNFLVDDVLGEQGLTSEQFHAFLRRMMVNTARARTGSPA